MSSHVNKEIRRLFLGDSIGKGAFREVFEHNQDPTLVVKIEGQANKRFCNIIEWELWQVAQGTELEKWLAPCVDISPCGTVLLQRRAEPIREDEFPDKVPACLMDLKVENWGRLNGKIVCVDYGNTLPDQRMRLKKVRLR